MSRALMLAVDGVLLGLLFVAATACGPAPTATPGQSTPTALAAVPTATPTATPRPKPSNPEVIMASTTSTGDSGLMDTLLPIFEKETGYLVKPVYVGTGTALAQAARGEADVVLVHSPPDEQTFMGGGNGVNRRLVMHNDFVVLGSPSDPAGIRGMAKPADAFLKLYNAGTPFYTRGVNSGTDTKEKAIWALAGVAPTGQKWYQQTGVGMGASLLVASEKGAYVLSDRATYLANSKNLALEIMVQGDPLLLNVYHVIQVNPSKSDKINAAGARAFSDFMVSPEAQRVIAQFGVEKYGQPLFFPDAGKSEDSLGGK